MPPTQERLQYLMQRYAADECTRQELLELLEVFAAATDDETLHSALESVWRGITDADTLPVMDKDRIFNRALAAGANPTPGRVHPLPVRKRRWPAVAAAAILILSIGAAGASYWYFRNPARINRPLAQNVFKNDVLPGSNKAILTLSNGTKIILDSAHNGALARQGNTTVIKLDGGQLAYKGGQSTPQPADIRYNTIATPRGGQYQVILPDGSKVWLNAASSLSFPTAFGGRERKVLLEGEAYFEIQKDKARPFLVEVGKMKVKVLGTRFDVMAYGDEEAVKTTLLDGAVRIWGTQKDSVTLNPGEQAELKKNQNLEVRPGIDVDAAIAWKDGLFYFHDADIKTVMRQLARWYNVEVTYNNMETKEGFYAKIPRATNLSTVLQALTLTGKLHIDIEGNRVTVNAQ